VSTLEEIERRADELRAKMFAILDMDDAQKIMEVAEELKLEATSLEKDAREWGESMEKQAKSARGRFEVVLTDDQQQRIRAATGVHMTSVFIDDASGRLNEAMPGTRRLAIEKIALEQARRQVAYKAAEQAARAEALQNLAVLEEQGGQMAELIAMLKEDPEFRKSLYLDAK
jgi:hypothetical protein